MFLIAGLGNPGRDYARHRHNAGFMAVDAIHARHDFGPWRKAFKGEIAEGFLPAATGARLKTLLIKPQTFMNLSGECVQAAAQFYKVPLAQIAVIYDELDLAAGKLRVQTGGGAAGHNGIRSLVQHLGAGFRRVRLGIAHPGDKARVSGHVLGNFTADDETWLTPLLAAIAAEAGLLASGDDAGFMNRITLTTQPQRPPKPKPAPADDKKDS